MPVLCAVVFISRLGTGVPILALMLLIAAAQGIMGPLIGYNLPNPHYKYFMYVDQPQYMSYVVPAFGAFAIAVYLGLGSSKTTFIGIENMAKPEVNDMIENCEPYCERVATGKVIELLDSQFIYEVQKDVEKGREKIPDEKKSKRMGMSDEIWSKRK